MLRISLDAFAPLCLFRDLEHDNTIIFFYSDNGARSEFTIGGSRRPAMIVLKGLQGPVTVKGQQYGTAVMQPWDKTLTDQKIADVLTYERSEWGNNASPVTAEQIAALRKELASHAESFTEHDILAVPDEDLPGGPAPAAGAPPKPGEAAKPAAPPKP